VLIVHQLSSILLDMDSLDPDHFVFRDPCFVISIDHQLPLTYERMIKLADLIALRQISVEVVLAVKPRPFVDLRIDCHTGPDRLTNALLIRHWQHAGHGRINEADLSVRLGAEGGRGSAEQLGI